MPPSRYVSSSPAALHPGGSLHPLDRATLPFFFAGRGPALACDPWPSGEVLRHILTCASRIGADTDLRFSSPFRLLSSFRSAALHRIWRAASRIAEGDPAPWRRYRQRSSFARRRPAAYGCSALPHIEQECSAVLRQQHALKQGRRTCRAYLKIAMGSIFTRQETVAPYPSWRAR